MAVGPEDTLEEEAVVIGDRDTAVSVDPGFEGVEDSHHHQQQHWGVDRVRVSHQEEDLV